VYLDTKDQFLKDISRLSKIKCRTCKDLKTIKFSSVFPCAGCRPEALESAGILVVYMKRKGQTLQVDLYDKVVSEDDPQDLLTTPLAFMALGQPVLARTDEVGASHFSYPREKSHCHIHISCSMILFPM
jgi:hypothetical protein